RGSGIDGDVGGDCGVIDGGVDLACTCYSTCRKGGGGGSGSLNAGGGSGKRAEYGIAKIDGNSDQYTDIPAGDRSPKIVLQEAGSDGGCLAGLNDGRIGGVGENEPGREIHRASASVNGSRVAGPCAGTGIAAPPIVGDGGGP